MIPNQWYVVMDSSQVKDKPVGVTRMGEKLVFWRDSTGTVSCLRDKCVHRGVQLSAGKVMDNGHIQCPFHGFEYDASGRVRVIPANGKNTPVPERFGSTAIPPTRPTALSGSGGASDRRRISSRPVSLTTLTSSFSYGKVYDPWDAHYSRVIENQLDVVHLPFVHHNTIGRGNRTLVDGPVVEWVDDDQFIFYVYNRVDDGTPPRKPEEITPDPARDFRLAFIFPNLWQNYIGENAPRPGGLCAGGRDAHDALPSFLPELCADAAAA